MILEGIVLGALNGAGMALAGWFKNRQDFDADQFGRTVIVGVIVGALAGAAGSNYTAAETWLGQTGAIGAVELAGKILWRRVKPLIFK